MTEPRPCNRCGKEINPKRIKILPHTTTCVNCSDASKVSCIPIISGKNEYTAIQIVSEATARRVAHQMNRKGSIVSNAMRGIGYKER